MSYDNSPLTLLSMTISRSIHVAADGPSFLFNKVSKTVYFSNCCFYCVTYPFWNIVFSFLFSSNYFQICLVKMWPMDYLKIYNFQVFGDFPPVIYSIFNFVWVREHTLYDFPPLKFVQSCFMPSMCVFSLGLCSLCTSLRKSLVEYIVTLISIQSHLLIMLVKSSLSLLIFWFAFPVTDCRFIFPCSSDSFCLTFFFYITVIRCIQI